MIVYSFPVPKQYSIVTNMKFLFSLSVILFSSTAVFSQQDIALTSTFYQALSPSVPAGLNEVAWVKPTFPGGQAEMIAFITNGITYPELAQENNIEGAVVIRLSLTADGEIFGVETLRSIGFGCDEAVLERGAKLPAFKSGLRYGQGVENTVVIPVRFRLC
jgi:protein TonB